MKNNTVFSGPYALSVEFDKDYIKYGIHRLKSYHSNCRQTSYLIFGIILTFGYFI